MLQDGAPGLVWLLRPLVSSHECRQSSVRPLPTQLAANHRTGADGEGLLLCELIINSLATTEKKPWLFCGFLEA